MSIYTYNSQCICYIVPGLASIPIHNPIPAIIVLLLLLVPAGGGGGVAVPAGTSGVWGRVSLCL